MGKEYVTNIYCHPAYLTYMQSTSREMPGWMKHELESRLLEKYQQTQICRLYHSNGRKWRRTKEPLDESERGEWKAGLKLNSQKMKIMTYHPSTSGKIDGETMETVTFLGSRITVDYDHSHEIKRHLLLGRKAMTNLNSILKSRDITLLTKIRIVKVMVFPVVMHGCESWNIKKAEDWTIDAFELWC